MATKIKPELFEKIIKDNLENFRKVNYNQSEFVRLLQSNYKECRDYTPQALRYKVNLYLSTNPIEQPEQTISETVSFERAERAERSIVSELKRRNEYLIKTLEESERSYDDLLNIKQPVDVFSINPSGKSSRLNRAIPIVSLSDWHIEERVESGVVNGFNDYNLKVAEERAKKLFINLIKVNTILSRDVSINDMVLWLGGDFISGYIHDELIENNQLSPLEAIRAAKKMIRSGIDFILSNTKLNLIIPCSVGNHGRNTKKMHISTSYKTNYEFMMYCDLQDYYQYTKRVTFHINKSDDCYVESLGRVNRFFHGEQIKYGGGIGGLTVPLIKFIHRKNQQQHADMNFLGHFHQNLYPTQDSCVNGSMIGLSGYGYKLGFKPEVPCQAYTLLNQKYGYTIKTPLFC
jgi:hypothetical protein